MHSPCHLLKHEHHVSSCLDTFWSCSFPLSMETTQPRWAPAFGPEHIYLYHITKKPKWTPSISLIVEFFSKPGPDQNPIQSQYPVPPASGQKPTSRAWRQHPIFVVHLQHLALKVSCSWTWRFSSAITAYSFQSTSSLQFSAILFKKPSRLQS